jgi:hypothetical protein
MRAVGVAGFGVVLLAAASATAQPAPLSTAPSPAATSTPPAAPAPSADDVRWRDLVERQRQLEEQVRAQAAQLRADEQRLELLQPATAPPPAPATAKFLAVPPEANPRDPDLAAPLAGYADKLVFLRDRHSWFVLVLKGRINVDWYNFLNRPSPPPGVLPNSAVDPRAALRDTVFIRRARVGLAGTIVRHIDWRVEGEFATVPATGQTGITVDGSVNIGYLPWLQLEAGQFYTPFTLENVTSENYIDFLDKAGPVRWAVPAPRDLGAQLWGMLPRRLGRYAIGVFNGDGQNYKNLDNRPAVIGRVFVAPLSLLPGHAPWLEEIWIGGSFWWQQAENIAGGVASTTGAVPGDLASLTTEGGFAVFSSNYGNGIDPISKSAVRSHLGPDGTVLKYAFEANVPVTARFGLRAEIIHQSIDLRRYDDLATSTAPAVGPKAFLDGTAGYVEAYAWIGGPINVDKPGLHTMPHWSGYAPPQPPRWAVQLAARYEHTEFAISGLPPTTNGGRLANDPAQGHYAIDTFLLGANFWVTRHARVLANYGLNYIGSGDPSQAAAMAMKNLFFQKLEHELLFRLQVNL